jgi:hypothetical protein
LIIQPDVRRKSDNHWRRVKRLIKRH